MAANEIDNLAHNQHTVSRFNILILARSLCCAVGLSELHGHGLVALACEIKIYSVGILARLVYMKFAPTKISRYTVILRIFLYYIYTVSLFRVSFF